MMENKCTVPQGKYTVESPTFCNFSQTFLETGEEKGNRNILSVRKHTGHKCVYPSLKPQQVVLNPKVNKPAQFYKGQHLFIYKAQTDLKQHLNFETGEEQ